MQPKRKRTRKVKEFTFEQFWAAIELQRATSPAASFAGLDEPTWRMVWDQLHPQTQRIVYSVIGVGLTQAQAAEDCGCTRGNCNNAFAKLKRILGTTITRDDLI